MLFLTMIPPSCFLGVFATSFYIKGVIWRSFLQKKNSNWIYYQYNTMMTRNTSIFTYKIIQSAAYSLIWLCRKWFLLFLSNDNIHLWFEDWPCPFIKLQKVFFSLKSCMQISALCVKFNDQPECNFTTISLEIFQWFSNLSNLRYFTANIYPSVTKRLYTVIQYI